MYSNIHQIIKYSQHLPSWRSMDLAKLNPFTVIMHGHAQVLYSHRWGQVWFTDRFLAHPVKHVESKQNLWGHREHQQGKWMLRAPQIGISRNRNCDNSWVILYSISRELSCIVHNNVFVCFVCCTALTNR